MTMTDDKKVVAGYKSRLSPKDGLWPIINLNATEDFANQPSQNTPGEKPAGSSANASVVRFLGIHMDVPLDSEQVFTDVRNALNRGDREEAHRILMERGKLPPGTPRAHAFLKTALRND